MTRTPHTRLRQTADSWQQVQAIRQLAQDHAQRFAQNQPSLPAGHRPLFAADDMRERRQWANMLTFETKRSVTAHLDRAEQLGATRRVAQAPRPDVFNPLMRDFPHFDEVTAHLQQRAALSRLGISRHLRLNPILLAGDPGVGKTAYAQAVAALLGVPFSKMEVGTMSAAFSLCGLDLGYESGKPGLLWDLLQNECMSPLVILDEIDKLGTDTHDTHLGPLYGLLEPVSATRFSDAALGLPVDASYVSWLATCNDVDRIEPALRTRFKRFDVPAPTPREMRPVVASIQRQIRRTEEWAASFPAELPEDVMACLCSMTPREARQALTDAYATAAMEDRRYLRPSDVFLQLDPPKPAMGFVSH
ncbi:MAG TPA: AAA family ATPase [Terriglobales bacterium]|jgi:ATP-dependent Lon protease|nr:AAA family ATPase [Terriglobales bacterium]